MRMKLLFTFVCCYLINRIFADVCKPCYCIPTIHPEVMICERSTVFEFPRYLPLSVKNGLKEIYIRNTSIVCLPDIKHDEYNSLNILKERFNFLLPCSCIIKWKTFLKIDCILDSFCLVTDSTTFENTETQFPFNHSQSTQTQIFDRTTIDFISQNSYTDETTMSIESPVNANPPSVWVLTGQVLTAIVVLAVVVTAIIKVCQYVHLKTSANAFGVNDDNNICNEDGDTWNSICLDNPSFEMIEVSS